MKNELKAKRKTREWTLQFLFSVDVEKNSLENFKQEQLQRFWDMMSMTEQSQDIALFQESIQAANERIRGIVENLESIDSMITSIATNWVISRMAVVDRNILRLAIYEMLYCNDIPLKVSINEALEVAKIFADKDSKKFINGILDKVKQEIESKEVSK